MIPVLLIISLFLSSCALPFDGVSCPVVPETGFITLDYVQSAQLILVNFVHFSGFSSSPLFMPVNGDANKVSVRLLETKSKDHFVLNMSVPETYPIGGTVALIRQDRVTGQVTANSSWTVNGTCSESDCGSFQNKVRIYVDKELLIIYSCEDADSNGGTHEEAVLLFYNPTNPFDIHRIKQMASNFLPEHLLRSLTWGGREVNGTTGVLEGDMGSELEFERNRLRNVKIFGVGCLLIAGCLVAHWVHLYKKE